MAVDILRIYVVIPRAQFFNFGTIDILGQMSLRGGGGPMCCRIFSSIPRLYLPVATRPPQLW